MLKLLLMISIFSVMVGSAYFSAQTKVNQRSDLHFLKLGMNAKEIRTAFGIPTSQNRNELTYILEYSSELIISFRDKVVTSAKVKYRRPLSAQELKRLTLVQMDSNESSSSPSYFFAGKPEEGLIYKISSDGLIESLTWVPPFTYGHSRPKNLQALLRDFNSHRTF